MENKKQVLEHISAILYPKVDDVVDNLKGKEIDMFIHFMVLELQQSLKKWENGIKTDSTEISR